MAVGPVAVVGFDPASGRVLWTLPRQRGPLNPPATDALADGEGTIVYTEGSDPTSSGLVAIDAATHRRLWRVILDQPAGGAPSVADGRVFLSGRDGFVYALDLGTGRVVWKFQTRGPGEGSPAAAGGMVFAVSVDPAAAEAVLYGIDANTGKSTWEFSTSSADAASSSPSVTGGTVYEGFGDGTIRAFDAPVGGVRWSSPVRTIFSPGASPAISGEDLYAQDRGGAVYRFRAQDGKRSWDYQFSAPSTAGSPLVVGSFVYAGQDDGTVGAIDVTTGHLVWRTHYSEGPIGALTPAGELLLAPVQGRKGGIVALGHDPGGSLTDEASPTELHLGVAVATFGGAFLLALGGILAWFRFMPRLTRKAGAGVPGDQEAPDE